MEGAWWEVVGLWGPFLVEQESCGECKVRDRGTRAAQDSDRAR